MNQPAFPQANHCEFGADGVSLRNRRDYGCEADPGMSYRQWLAGKIMAALLGNASADYEWDGAAQDALAAADALIKRLEKVG